MSIKQVDKNKKSFEFRKFYSLSRRPCCGSFVAIDPPRIKTFPLNVRLWGLHLDMENKTDQKCSLNIIGRIERNM